MSDQRGLNPYEYNKGDKIRSIYTRLQYQVIEPDKKGMANLKNLKSGEVEDWNACNNPHFEIMAHAETAPPTAQQLALAL
jgi:hypothetical protein